MTESIDVLEALLFASDAPVEAATIQDVLELPSADAARALVAALRARLDQHGALQVIEVAGGFRLVTRPELAPWLVRLARAKTRSRLSRPALETLAIIAYRQPVSRPEVDATRGVNSEGVLDNLLERRLIRIAGRKDSPGRPFLYETTREFLVAFGLRDLGDLPKADTDLVVVDPAAAGASAAPAEAAEAAHAEEEIAGAESITDEVEAIAGDDEGTAAGVDGSAADARPAAAVDVDTSAIADIDAADTGHEREAAVDVADVEAMTDVGDDVEVAVEQPERAVRDRAPADPDVSTVVDADTAAPSADPAADAVAASHDANGSGGAEPTPVDHAFRADRDVGVDRSPASGANDPADTEDASAAEHPPQQDPGAGGADVATRR